MNPELIEENIRLQYESKKLHNEIDRFIENYICEECDGGVVYPNGKKYCTHLLRDYKKKFLPKLLKLARKQNDIIMEKRNQELDEVCQPFLISRYA